MINKWEIEKLNMKKIYYGIMGKPIDVKDVPPESNEVAFTSEGGAIHVCYQHKIMKNMREKDQPVFRLGLFAHEMLHQVFTDFSYRAKQIGRMSTMVEKQVLASISNLVEDGSIEHYAGRIIGGYLLKALKFMIAWLYQETGRIEDAKTPYAQFIRAMVQFEGGGLLKGQFTFPEAKKIFTEIAPYYMQGIKEKDPRKRVDLSLIIMEKSRPLWEKEADFENILRQLIQQGILSMENNGNRSKPSQTDSMKDSMDEAEGEEDYKDKNRAKTMAVLCIQDEGTPDQNSGTDENGKSNGDKSGSGNPTQLSAGASSPQANSEGLGAEICRPDKSSGDGKDQDSIDPNIEQDLYLGEDVIDTIQDSFNNIEKDEKRKENEAKRDNKLDNISFDMSFMKNVKVYNEIVHPEAGDEFQTIVTKYVSNINGLRATLKQIFKKKEDEKTYAYSGRISLKRMASGKTSARIFERRRIPGDKHDMAILILVDESYSMAGEKIVYAKECCISLAETFYSLRIPIYIMGFTADLRGYDANHYHYVQWNNYVTNRTALTKMTAKDDNFDGYSIRYAGEILKKRPESHKLMVVISDGRPVADAYSRHQVDGYTDTKNAIHEMRKCVGVFGVAIGKRCCEEDLQKMYGRDFIHVEKPQEMFLKIGDGIKKIVKSWE